MPSSPRGATSPQQPPRLASLDGLRGIAAIVVVLFHVALVSPVLASVERAPHVRLDLVAALAYSPLRILWSGDEAVVVFFVLSGLVLAVPLRNRSADWIGYYPRRILRLYLPVWGAIVLALTWWIVVPRVSRTGDSWWIAEHHFALTLRGVAGDATMLLGTTQTNSVLWSLRWEVWFSLLLPLYLLVLLRFRRFPLAKVLVLAAAAEAGQLMSIDWLRWMPVFGLGVVAAAEFERVRPAIAGLARLRGALLLAGVLLLLEIRWATAGVLPLGGVSALGALGLVLLFAAWGPATAVGTLRPVAWLGRVSFSLYLAHEPVVVSTALLLRTRDPLVVAPIAIPLALLLAAAFHRVVEVPAHRLSREVGRRASNSVRRRRTAARSDPAEVAGVRRGAPSP